MLGLIKQTYSIVRENIGTYVKLAFKRAAGKPSHYRKLLNSQ